MNVGLPAALPVEAKGPHALWRRGDAADRHMVIPVSSDSDHSPKQTHQHQHQHHHHDFNVDWSVRGDQLELEGETLAPITIATIQWARSRIDPSSQVERIVDVGCGPGVASCMLAATFDHAEVIALDASTELLAAAIRRADLR
ncbi:MAG: class I SAM-dependent methyltransferase, partial [Ilumatobacteraceae bacterium]